MFSIEEVGIISAVIALVGLFALLAGAIGKIMDGIFFLLGVFSWEEESKTERKEADDD